LGHWTFKNIQKFNVSKDTKPATYRLRDIKDDEILGGFYKYELHKDKTTGMHKIKKILKNSARRGKRQ